MSHALYHDDIIILRALRDDYSARTGSGRWDEWDNWAKEAEGRRTTVRARRAVKRPLQFPS